MSVAVTAGVSVGVTLGASVGMFAVVVEEVPVGIAVVSPVGSTSGPSEMPTGRPARFGRSGGAPVPDHRRAFFKL